MAGKHPKGHKKGCTCPICRNYRKGNGKKRKARKAKRFLGIRV